MYKNILKYIKYRIKHLLANANCFSSISVDGCKLKNVPIKNWNTH